MNKKFTKLMAALALLVFMTPSLAGWGQSTKTLQLSSTAKFGTTSPANLTQDAVQWTCTQTGSGAIQNSYNTSYKGQQFGTSSAKWEGTFSTSGISGTITKIEVGANTGGTGKLSVKVGDTDFVTGTNNLTTATIYQNSSNCTNVTFTGGASGAIVITTWDAGSSTKAFYLNHITVTYTTGPLTYAVTYKHGVDATGEDLIDSGYSSGSLVTIKGVGGTDEPAFTKTGWHFVNWKDTENGTSATLTLEAGDSYSITSNTTLFAQWAKNTHAVALGSVDNVTLTATYGSNTITEGNAASAVEYGTAITLNASGLATDYAFVWQITKTDGGDDVTSSVLSGTTLTVPDYDITISGTVVPVYTVTYDCNDGTSGCPSAEPMTGIAAGTSITLAAAPIKTGSVFMGWNDGTTTYEAGATYTVNSTVTLTAQWTVGGTGTIAFNSTSSGIAINGASVSGNDNLGNTWTVTTVGTTSFTSNSGYYQVGSSNKPASSITFTMTLPEEALITNFSAKFGGFSTTAGTVTMKVGATTVGSGSLNTSSDVVINNNSSAFGSSLTVTVTNITAGVKCYYISYTYTISSDPIISAPNTINLSCTDINNEFEFDIVNPVSGKTLSATTSTSWISNVVVDNTNNMVSFTTSENETTTDRSGSITLSYDGANDKVVTIIQSQIDYATMPLVYTGGKNNLPTGFTQSGLDSDYSDANAKLKFDSDGDYVVLKLKEAPVSLTYSIKGNSFSAGYFDVRTSADGVTYSDLANYVPTNVTSDVQTITHVDLGSTVRYIKWVFTDKITGNIGIGNIHVTTEYDIYGTATTASLEPTSSKKCTIYSGGMLTVTGTLENSDPANLIIEDGGQLVTSSSNVQATVQRTIAAHGATAQDGGWNFIASPISTSLTPSGLITDELGNNVTPETATYDLYYYDETEHYWRNYRNSTFNMNNGQGYLYANKVGTTISFSGTLRASNAAYTISDLSYNSENGNLAGFNLVGNPFACNATVDKSCYIIQNGVIVATTETVAAPCSGVMVQTTAAGQSVTITPTTDAAVFSTGNNQLNITIANKITARGESSMIDNAIVSFNENSQLEKFVFNEDNAKLYIPQNDKEYAIVSAEAQGELPVNFKASTDGTYTLTVSPEGVEMNYLHLIDNMTGMDVDLLQTPSYTFDATTNDYESRFRLVFAGTSTSSATDESFAYYNGSEWQVNNEGEATLQVVDVMGRIVSTETVNGSFNLSLNQGAGVYMLRLINSNGVKTQKIVVR